MKFEGSRTHANLMAAFAGESQARTKYSIYAERAKKDGYEQMAEIFRITANNEEQHAKIWLKQIHGGDIPPTHDNLLDAAAGEAYEWTEMYKDFERVAREEGFWEIAALFSLVGSVEKEHEERYRRMIKELEEGIVFEKTQEVVWLCRNCGYVHTGKTAPQMCPVCAHPQAFFEEKKN